MRKYKINNLDSRTGEAAGKVSSLYDIDEDGVYEVDGYDRPVSAESCTEYGADELREQGYKVICGRVMIPFGEWVD